MSSYLDIYLVIFLLPLKNIYYFYNKNISQWNSGRHRGFNVIRVLFFRRRPFFKCKLICFYCGLYFTSDCSVIFFFVIIWIYLSHKVEETGRLRKFKFIPWELTIKLTLPNMEAGERPFRVCAFPPSNFYKA